MWRTHRPLQEKIIFIRSSILSSLLHLKQLLKKTNQNPDVFNNCRPVTNLPFLSKVLEKLVFSQLNDFLTKTNAGKRLQSGFWINHSTETVLLKIVNGFMCNMNSEKILVLVLRNQRLHLDPVAQVLRSFVTTQSF